MRSPTHHRHTPAPSRGFTLIEVLVAMMIMAIMAMMSWRGMDAIVRTRDISQTQLERTMRLQTVMSQWEQDLAAVQDVGGVPALRFDGATLRLTRRRPDGMQVVAWSKQGNAWARWESGVSTQLSELQDSYMRSLQLQSNSPGIVRAIEGVSGWQVYFYRGNGWSNAQSSDDLATNNQANVLPPSRGGSAPQGGNGGGVGPAPPTSSAVTLPTGVKVALQFEEDSGWTGPLNRAIAIGAQQ